MCSENSVACLQAHSQGGASGFNTPTMNVKAPSSYLQNIKDKQADQPPKKRVTFYYIHIAPAEVRWLEKINFKIYIYIYTR